MSDVRPCHCHSNLPYRDCCEPFHSDNKLPETALRLMRSRYSAYVLRLVDYLVDTTHPDKRKASLRKNLTLSVPHITWTKLTILKTSSGTKFDKAGKVSFEATYTEEGREHTMAEHSRFRKRAGKWYYYDGKG